MTAADARHLDQLLELRDALFEGARMVIADDGTNCTLHESEKVWRSIRRRYYRFSKLIPKRYRKPFPAFKPTASNRSKDEN